MSGGIVPFDASATSALADVWFRSARAAHPYLPALQALGAEAARELFRTRIMPGLEIWMACESLGPVGFLGMKGELIDRLYVDPEAQGMGWGSRLLAFAKSRHPDGLRLFTHAQNAAARRFYEQRGFVAVRFGISPPPESLADVEYAWRPDA